MNRSGWSDRLLANQALFAALPAAARAELAEEMRDIAGQVLALQRRAAPVYAGKSRKGVKPGLLKGQLSIAEAISSLRIRIGFPQLGKSRSKAFYAIWMEYGRRAQEVFVRRLKKGGRASWRQAIAEGRARRGRKPIELTVGYRLRVTALPARRFVHQEGRLEAITAGFGARFWDNTLNRAGGA